MFLLCVTLPPMGIAIVWGGRGVAIALMSLLLIIIGYLIWYFLIYDDPASTGMEGLALFVAPLVWLAIAMWWFVIYSVIWMSQSLPYQRAKRRMN